MKINRLSDCNDEDEKVTNANRNTSISGDDHINTRTNIDNHVVTIQRRLLLGRRGEIHL